MVWEAPVVEVFMVGRSEIISTIPGRLIPGGGTLRHNSAMNQFLEVVEECALVDLGYCGRKITWTNGQRGVNNIGERLDRALANEKWCLSFSFFRVQHLVRMKSNHSPVLLNFEVERSNGVPLTNQREGEEIAEILHTYEEASGQKVNLDKSEMTTSGNTVSLEETGWRVGNGWDIKVWQDKWVGMDVTEHLLFRENSLPADATVEVLMDVENKTWNEDLVRRSFTHEEANKILKYAPLAKDCRVIRDFGDILSLESIRYGQHTIELIRVWHQMFQLEYPQAQLWRFLYHQKYGTSCDERSRIHYQLNQKWHNEGVTLRQYVRFVEKLQNRGNTCASNALLCNKCGYLWEKTEHYSCEYINLFCMLAWSLWNARNRFCFEGKQICVPEVIASAQRILGENQMHQTAVAVPLPHRPLNENWQPPNAGRYKVNTDAGVFRDGYGVYVFVVRDSVGNAFLAGAKRVVMQCSSTVAEACSMRWALETIKACGIRILEVDGLNDNTCPEIHEELLVQDIRADAKDLDVKSFTFTRRNANKVAHKLAKLK
ncbi:conserved hypothetical protein [Ricinus communis]|uniref:RNase H type-1 domain-containing protein n=1 Tax=Ricinus communis TaxID=3988 RepID=B9SIQ9_RICCO|nr:conserved hypothetical protein [Ricinus communis]